MRSETSSSVKTYDTSIRSFATELEANPRYRNVAVAIITVWSATIALTGAKTIADDCFPNQESPACIAEQGPNDNDASGMGSSGSSQEELALQDDQSSLLSSTSGAPEQDPTLVTAPAVPVIAICNEPNISKDSIYFPNVESVGTGLDPQVAQNIAEIRLSLDGYCNFLKNIDSSTVDHAGQFTEFNGTKMSQFIPQNEPVEFFTLHYTAGYSNDEYNTGSSAVGDFNPGNLVRLMVERFGANSQCCGANWAIGRAGGTFQLAGLNQRLNANPPFDAVSTDVEIEALDQATVVTKQYEEVLYLAIAVLDTQQLLGNYALQDILVGHAEVRNEPGVLEELLALAPLSKPGDWHKSDFPHEVMVPLRSALQALLDQHPEIIGNSPLTYLPH